MKYLILVIIFFASSTIGFTQEFEISEAPRTKDNGTYNSFLFELPDVDKDRAEKTWEKFMKDFKVKKTKYNRKSKMYHSESAIIPQISDDRVNVYARILEDKNPDKKTTIIVWFDVNNDYVKSEVDSTKGAYLKAILTEYAMSTSKQNAEAIVKSEEKSLSGLEKDLKKLKKENKELKESIEKAKKAIAKNEKAIEINVLDQKKKAEEIAEQKEIVSQAKENVGRFQR